MDQQNTFSMTYQEVESAIAQLSKYADAIKSSLDQVSVASNQVTADEWRGKSADTYKDAFETLRPKFDLFYSKIVECVDYLNTAIGKNQSADVQVSSTFKE